MAGRFINIQTTHSTMTNTVIDTAKTMLNNPYYLYSDKKGSECIYYNINDTMSTLDEASRTNYSELGPNSPIRYNKVNNFMLYGISKMEVNLDIGEVGLEADTITGDAIILPDTIRPYPGDFFILTQYSKPYLFKVTKVDRNLLDTEKDMYRINYMLAYSDQASIADINRQVVKNFNFVVGNVGTNYACIIEEDVYNISLALQELSVMLKDYFYNIFWDTKVQTFIYTRPHHCTRVYDPYLIEFIIKNKILNGASHYVSVMQQLYLPLTFRIEYDKTMFRSLELKSVDRPFNKFIGKLIPVTEEQQLSLLYQYCITYFYMDYSPLNKYQVPINIFGDSNNDILNKIKSNSSTSSPLYNAVIKYLNGEDFTEADIKAMYNIDYYDSCETYYGIPMAIYCIEQHLHNTLSTTTSM